MTKKSFRLDDALASDLTRMAAEQNTTETAVVEAALRMYRDYQYMERKASILPQEITRTFQASLGMVEQRLNNRSNVLLSELAIQQCVLCQVLANNLEINPADLDGYRRAAVNFLRSNNRVFKLSDAFSEVT